MKCDDRQMRVPVESLDLDVESSTGLSRDQHLWFGTRRRTRPVRPWLDSRSTMSREATEVDLVGRLAAERSVWTVLVGPIDERVHLPDHGFSPCGDNDPFQPIFDGPNRSFENGNTAVLPDGTKSRPDVVLSAPALVSRRGPELASFVTDQMPRCRSGGSDRTTEESENIPSRRRISE